MNRIEQIYIINAQPEQVWQALTEPDIISQWSGAPASFEATPDTDYALWDGSVRGRIVDVIPLKQLVQTWKPDNWNEENSVVTFTLTPDERGTRVDLVHENVQDWDYDATTHGWDIYYLGAIKHMLESQAPAEAAPVEKKASAKKAAAKKAPAKKRIAVKKAGAKKAAAKKTAAKRGATKKSSAKRRR